MRKKLLWIGDAACDSGFDRCTRETLRWFPSEEYEITVLGLNYRGDPYDETLYPYKIYPAARPFSGEDAFGVKRTLDVTLKVKPDVVVIQQDPWNFPAYVQKLDLLQVRPAVVGIAAVDGKNCRGKDLNGLDHVIFWTQFGESEAKKGGFLKQSTVIGLGVDRMVYNTGDKMAARERLGIPEQYRDGFIYLNVNRNQPRKRLDLSMEYFAEFFHGCDARDAYLYMHVCPTGDLGYDCDQLTAYYGLRKHVMLAEPGVFKGATEEELADTYRAADVQISTTQGEGWGLTTMEGMACGLPQVFPRWSALGEWAAPAGLAIPCSTTAITPGRVNSVGGIADKAPFASALYDLYSDAKLRDHYRVAALTLADQPKYRWSIISDQVRAVLDQTLQSVNLLRGVVE